MLHAAVVISAGIALIINRGLRLGKFHFIVGKFIVMSVIA